MKAARIFPYAVAIAVGVASFCPAHAEDWKATGQFGWFGVGKAFQIEKVMSIGWASSPALSSTTKEKAVCLIGRE